MEKTKKNKILLIQPSCGKYDMYICDIPLSLIYVSSKLVQDSKFNVKIFDQRTVSNWETELKKELDESLLFIGLTVMTGEPIKYALNICKFIKARSSAPIVWGGIHPTLMPEQTVEHELVDYVIMGKGEHSILDFAEYLQGSKGIEDINGLVYKDSDGRVIRNKTLDNKNFDWETIGNIPYEQIDHSKYYRSGFDKKVVSIMTSRNCPHKCTFCYNSSLKGTGERWSPEPVEQTKKNISYLLQNYKPDYLSFIDDDFFVNKTRVLEIFDFIEEQKYNVKIGFRGARVDELLKYDESFFHRMEKLKVCHINIGVESGSSRILKILKKGITPEQVIELNQRFAKFPKIVPLYNFFSGIPGETVEDIKLSTNLILRLIKDDPNCQISGFHQYTPYPGSELFQLSKANGFKEPSSLHEWGEMQLENNARNCPWISKRRRSLLNVIYTMIYFVDRKYDVYFMRNSALHRFIYPLILAYRPIAKWRLKYHITIFPIEVYAKDLFYWIADFKKKLTI